MTRQSDEGVELTASPSSVVLVAECHQGLPHLHSRGRPVHLAVCRSSLCGRLSDKSQAGATQRKV
jgi:hypothetical protein